MALPYFQDAEGLPIKDLLRTLILKRDVTRKREYYATSLHTKTDKRCENSKKVITMYTLISFSK